MHYIRFANMLTGADVGGHGGRPSGPIGGRGPPGGGPPLIGPPGPYMCGGGGPLSKYENYGWVARMHLPNFSVGKNFKLTLVPCAAGVPEDHGAESCEGPVPGDGWDLGRKVG